MARYVKDLALQYDPNTSFAAIQQYLASEGFEYITYEGENVFKKGKGVFVAPTFIKVTFGTSSVRVESWLKYALLPGVYVGEIGMEGFVGFAVKGTMKRCVARIEQMLGGVPANWQNTAYVQPQTPPVQNAAPTFCPGCGSQHQAGQAFCANCGSSMTSNQYAAPNPGAMGASPIPAGPISKGEYRRNYAPEKFKRDIRTISIICYVLTGICFLMGALDAAFLLDGLVYLGLTLGMHLRKSKGCAIAILVYSAIGCILTLISTGQLGGYLWIASSIWALVTFSNADKQYNELMASKTAAGIWK